MAIKERLGKRNLAYNKRHREYGDRLIMEDIDTVEYHADTNEPVAVIETKFGLVKEIDLNSKQNCRQAKLANKLGVPYFCLVYYIMDKRKKLIDAADVGAEVGHVQYYLIPVNRRAVEILSEPEAMTECQYVEFLYKLRGEVLPKQLELTLYKTWLYTSTVDIPTVKNMVSVGNMDC